MTMWDFISNAWNGFVDYARTGSGHVLNIIRAVLYALMLFDVWKLTPEKMIALLAIAESVLQGIAAKTTITSGKMEQRKQESFDKGVAVGVASTGSGTGSGYPPQSTSGLSQSGIG